MAQDGENQGCGSIFRGFKGIVLEKKDIGLQMSEMIKKLLEREDIYNNLANGAFESFHHWLRRTRLRVLHHNW